MKTLKHKYRNNGDVWLNLLDDGKFEVIISMEFGIKTLERNFDFLSGPIAMQAYNYFIDITKHDDVRWDIIKKIVRRP
jgi:hypothetical protein